MRKKLLHKTMKLNLPTFVGIGAQKAGTTTLYRLLKQHPQIFMAECKEVHYFDQNFEQPLKWYLRHFESCIDGQKTGEITPYYLFHPDVPGHIKTVLPNAKLIVLLRDPVERTLSHIFHARKRGFETLSPEEALAAEEDRMERGTSFSKQKHSYISRSKYIEQLDRYETLFPKTQMLIIKSEDLFEEGQKAWEEIQQFIGVAVRPLKKIIPKANRGDGQSELISKQLREKLKIELYETAQEVRRRYGFGWKWSK